MSDFYFVVDTLARVRSGSNGGDAKPVKAVVDVGGAVGHTTLTFLDIFSAAHIFVFEPQTSSLQILKRRIARQADRVTIFPVGLFSEDTKKTLNLCSHNDSSSLLSLPHLLIQQNKCGAGSEEIELRRLDEIFPTLGCERIDFLKIDVEGIELAVIQGGFETIRDRTDNIYVEIDPFRKTRLSTDHTQLFMTLHECGFSFVGYFGDYWFSKDPGILDYFFGPETDSQNL